jgi:hypothetical protein
MRRVTLSEIHEQPWFPKKLRDDVTDTLQFIFNFVGMYRPIVPRLGAALHSAESQRVIDLCSGGGGPWIWLRAALANSDSARCEVLLTDRFPNLPAFERAERASGGTIHFLAEPVDAQAIPASLRGFRTIFSSIHHFSPIEVAAILRNTVERGEGIGFFEAAKRRTLTALSAFLMPIGALCLVPFMRPFRFARLFWTYLLPVIPFVLLFDGVLSCLRAYSPDELRDFASSAAPSHYTWDAGELGGVTYLIGYPNSRPS